MDTENKEQITLTRIGCIMGNKKLTVKERVSKIINSIKSEYELPVDTKNLPNTQNVSTLDKEVINILPESIPLMKGDIIKTIIGPCQHYSIVYGIDTEYNTAFVIPLTSDKTIELALPINSRIFGKTFYLPYFAPVFLSKNNYTFIGIFDNPKELENMIGMIKLYYKNGILPINKKNK